MQPRAKHPPGLSVLFMSEVWERFGFYIAQGLLVFYMTQKLHFSDARSYNILGAFTALAYIMPVIGGYIADKILGYRQAVLWGGIILCLGYAALAVSDQHSFYLALAIVVLGTALFKPNVSSLVGKLYKMDDHQRDAGFTLFYMGINLGIISSTLTSGFVAREFGWSASYAMASVGMIIAVITFMSGKKSLMGYGEPNIAKDSIYANKIWRYLIVFAFMILIVGASAILIRQENLSDIIFALFSVVLIFVLISTALRYDKTQRNKLFLLLVLIIASIFFWALYFQMFFSLALFIQRNLDRYMFGKNIPAVAFMSMESFFVIALSPIMAWLWTRLKYKKQDLSLTVKFAWALVFLGLTFLIIVASTYLLNAEGQVYAIWILCAYFFVALGELFLSPIGLSMIIELAPPSMVGMLMGVWFFSLGVGGKLAGAIAEWAAIPEKTIDIAARILIYRHAFLAYAIIGLSIGLLMLLASAISRHYSK